MKNIHILPTNKPSRLTRALHYNNSLRLVYKNYKCDVKDEQYQNIYITSGEEIKEVDWYIINSKYISKCVRRSKTYINGSFHTSGCKKIILTTDQDLINDGVQEIPDEFLEWFVKNPSCEWVEVGYGVIRLTENDNKGYWISIPNAEFNMSIEESKQETLEKAAEKYSEKTASIKILVNDMQDRLVLCESAFEAGAKWQQEQEQNNENSWFNEYQEVEDYIIKRIGDKFLEATPEKYNTASEATIALLENNWQSERMYSEEEVHDIIESYQNNVENNPVHITYDKWFEQFKKN